MSLQKLLETEDLINESERYVLTELERQLAEHREACTTTECILDMAAYALNKVRPRYRVNLLGRLFSSVVEDDYMQEVRDSVAEAIRVVSSNPPSAS